LLNGCQARYSRHLRCVVAQRVGTDPIGRELDVYRLSRSVTLIVFSPVA
jgi:hypothetical protein